MHLVLLELAHQVVDFLGLRHEIRRTNQRLPAEGGGLREMWQQVLDIEDTAHVVDGILIDWNTRIVVLHDTLDHIRKLGAEVEVNDVLTTRHHLFGRLIAEAHDAFQHILLVLQFFLVGQFQSLFQVIHAQHVILLLDDFLRQNTRAQENARQRIEQFAKEGDTASESPAHRQRVLSTIHLRHNLAEE